LKLSDYGKQDNVSAGQVLVPNEIEIIVDLRSVLKWLFIADLTMVLSVLVQGH
jgi:hypothetical protein